MRARRAVSGSGRLVALVLLIAAFSAQSPQFLTQSNWLNTSIYATTTLLLGLGETMVIITAGIDLSVGAILGVSSSVAAVYLVHAGPGVGQAFVAVVIALACGAGMGLLNSAVITLLGVTPFITTLGTLGIGTGVTYLLTNGSDIAIPGTIAPLGNTVWAGWIPVPVAVTAVACVAAFYLLRFTRFGIHTYAIGSNVQGARRAGVNVTRHLVAVYTLSGLFAGIAGALTLARFAVGSPTAGQDAELDAIAAVVIGGASLFGGEGGIGGTIVGSIFVSGMVTGLVLVGVVPYWQTIAIGILIIAAVAIREVTTGTRWERARRRLRGAAAARQGKGTR
jgi:ribose transport system permease protein